MKKSCILLLIITLLTGLITLPFASYAEEGEIIVLLDGQKVEFDQPPIIQNDRTLVPIRFVAENMGAAVSWYGAAQTATIVKGGKLIMLIIGDPTAQVDGVAHPLDSPPIIVNDRTLVPLRFIAEAFDAYVDWIDETRTAVISMTAPEPSPSVQPSASSAASISPSPSKTPGSSSGSGSGSGSGKTSSPSVTPSAPPSTPTGPVLSLGGKAVQIGDSLTQVVSVFGKEGRIDATPYGFNWHIYNGDYAHFVMIGIAANKVVALYTNSSGFKLGNASYGDTAPVSDASNILYYTDENENNKLYACLVMPESVPAVTDHDLYLKVIALENIDITNAYRANFGLAPLEYDDKLTLAARNHSQDMAANDYFQLNSKDGKTPLEMYRALGGKLHVAGANIARGSFSSMELFANILSTDTQKNNLLHADFKYVGMGMGINTSSTYKYFFTQFFGMEDFVE